ncbi:MAG TPA: MATE family efflux transporter [Solirubrobacterales bacterium]|nr:MATE family efflux transporter [Solirubrobacterales bacterium]
MTPPGRLSGAAASLRGEIARNRTVLSNAGSMMGTVLVTAGLGAAFWLVAARQFSPEAVGVASAAVAAMMLIGYLATVGFGTLLMGELPRLERGHRGLLNAALLISGALGAVLGLVFAYLAPFLSADLEPLSDSFLAALVFALGVGLTGLTAVLDQALIGFLRGNLQLARNVVFSAVKLVALAAVGFLLADAGGDWIYGTWTLGIAVSLVVLTRFYLRRGEDRLRPRFAHLNSMRFDAATHHVYNLAIRAPDLLLPLIVVSMLSAEANANFYIAWMIASFGFMVPVSLSSVLFAVGSGDAERLSDRYRLSVGLSAGTGVAINLVLLFAGGPILSLFGASYEQEALAPLHILALGVFPETIKAHFLSISRVERRIPQTIPLVIGGTVLEMAGAIGGGLTGSLSLVALGWLLAVCVEAAVMSRDVFRFLRPRRPGSELYAAASAAPRRPSP